MTIATVKLWGKAIGAVSWAEDAGPATFEYEPEFVDSGIEIAPITMSSIITDVSGVYVFPDLYE